MTPKVSSCIISYNQRPFIAHALEAALLQQVDGRHEIVFGDDASTDGTLEVGMEMANSDDRIRVLAKEANLGMHANWSRTIEACQGEYIALCEGDDYWNDSLKLQKQIDLLEANPKASACFSNARIVDENDVVGKYPYVDKEYGVIEEKQFFELNFNPVPTCTLVFRKSMFVGFPKPYYSSPFADWILHTILIQKGPYLYLNETTSSYRKHSGGIWSGIKEEKQLQNKLKALKIIRSIVHDRNKESVNSAIRKQLDQLLYFYRDQNDMKNYWITWFQLKLAS